MNRIALASLWLIVALGCAGEIVTGTPNRPGADPRDPMVDPGGDPVIDVDDPPDPASCAPLARRLWKLTPTQIERTLTALLGEPVEVERSLSITVASGGRFSNAQRPQTMNLPHVESLVAVADLVASRAAVEAPACDDATCLRPWLEAFGARAFRRPLTAVEHDRYLAFFESARAADPADVAVEQVVRAIVLSPSFVYRTELGPEGADADGEVSLTGHEVAQLMSYLLTDGPPDDELLAAAADGSLREPSGREAQAARLIAASPDGLEVLFRDWFRLEEVAGANRDEALFPDFSSEVSEAMVEESRRFVRAVLAADGRLATLLTADWTVIDRELADFYGLPSPGRDFGRVDLTGTDRAPGILGHGAFLAAQAQFQEGDLVKRGRFVREGLLCEGIEPPPPNVEAVFPESDGMTTQRDRLAAHTDNPVCASCHVKMDPIGYGFGHYDAVGRYMELEFGQPIDDTGEVVGLEDATYEGATELTALLASAPEVEQCVVRRVHEYATGRVGEMADACTLFNAYQAFLDTDGDMRAIVLALVADERFDVRHQEQQ